MNTVDQRLQIMESLNYLDHSQTEQLLAYAQKLVSNENAMGYQKFKRQAMAEIRQALNNQRVLNPGK